MLSEQIVDHIPGSWIWIDHKNSRGLSKNVTVNFREMVAYGLDFGDFGVLGHSQLGFWLAIK